MIREIMPKEIIFIGGGDYRKKENLKIDNYLCRILKKGAKIIFIPFAVKEIEKRESRVNAISNALKEHKEFFFFVLNEDKQTKEEMIKEVNEGDALFILGGDPILLLNEIKRLGLKDTIINFEGVLIGYSAGAMILSEKLIIPGGMDKNYPNSKILEGVGEFDFSIVPHYTPESNSILKELSKNKEIYAIPDKSALIIKNGGRIKKIGKVYSFKGNMQTTLK